MRKLNGHLVVYYYHLLCPKVHVVFPCQFPSHSRPVLFCALCDLIFHNAWIDHRPASLHHHHVELRGTGPSPIRGIRGGGWCRILLRCRDDGDFNLAEQVHRVQHQDE